MLTIEKSQVEIKHKKLPPTSLIICSRNRPEMLQDTVRSVLAGTELPMEIVVIDQSDRRHNDLTELGAGRECAIRYIWSAGRGLSRARNDGLLAARHDILVLLDDDMYVAHDWFSTLICALLEAGPHAVVTGQIRAADDVADGMATSLKTDPVGKTYQGRAAQGVLYSNAAFHREDVSAVGMFDERLGAGSRFPAAEDNDYCFRLLEHGCRIVYTPAPVVYHRAWRSSHAYRRLRWSYGRGQGAFYAKHVSLRDRYILALVLADLHRRSSAILAALRSDRRTLSKHTFYLLGLCSGFTEWLLTQRRRA